MITLEQVDRLREKANISYDEAKAALEATNGDLLEALINLEKQGKVSPPEGGGYHNGKEAGGNSGNEQSSKHWHHKQSNPNRRFLADSIRGFVGFCAKIIHKGNINSVEVIKDGEVKTAFSITVLVVLALCFFWITVPLLVIGLFLGYRYRFCGPDLGRNSVNNAMDNAAAAAENLKKTLSDSHQPPNQ